MQPLVDCEKGSVLFLKKIKLADPLDLFQKAATFMKSLMIESSKLLIN